MIELCTYQYFFNNETTPSWVAASAPNVVGSKFCTSTVRPKSQQNNGRVTVQSNAFHYDNKSFFLLPHRVINTAVSSLSHHRPTTTLTANYFTCCNKNCEHCTITHFLYYSATPSTSSPHIHSYSDICYNLSLGYSFPAEEIAVCWKKDH